MDKLEGTATFADEATAREALQVLAALRYDEGNDIVGGAHDVRVADGKSTVTFSYRFREGADTKDLERQIKDALSAGKPKLSRGAVDMEDDEYYDESAGRMQLGRSNRVVHTYVDEETGETRERKLIGKTRLARLVDDDGTEIGRVPVRSQYDEDGNKVTFPGPAGEADPAVQVEKG